MELTDSANPAPVKPAEDTPSPETPAPEVKKEDAPADPAPENPEVKPEEVLYETPDGRKVNAETLQKEWKENFLPEFTRKSQRLAELERGVDTKITNPHKDEPEWKKPDYVPKDYAEVIELAKKEAINEIQNSYQEEQARIKSIQDSIDAEVNEIKKIDPKLDENALFQHANKYGFRDLKAAYANMTDMRKVVVDTEQRTVKNLKTREADPIAANPGGDLPDDSGYDPKKMSSYDSAGEYLNSLKGNK